jgi:N-acetylmuramoyl-L-alanine amidase
MATIVIDPGHGGTTAVGGSSPNNARGPGGTPEKTFTLDVGRRLAARCASAAIAEVNRAPAGQEEAEQARA